jgi:hypothetical protein
VHVEPLLADAWCEFVLYSPNVAEAIALARHAIEEDPLDVWSRMNLHAYLQAAACKQLRASNRWPKIAKISLPQAAENAPMG